MKKPYGFIIIDTPPSFRHGECQKVNWRKINEDMHNDYYFVHL